MNGAKLKSYAPQARRDFIQAGTDRAAYFGLTAKQVEPITEKADVVVIAGRAHPSKVADQRKALEERVRRDGFERTMESLAYTWFNRLVAIRFLELHDYLENGEGGASYRVLSGRKTTKHTKEDLEALFGSDSSASFSCVSCVSWLMDLFEDAKTFGSLIQIPSELAAKLPEMEQRVQDVLRHGDLTHVPAGALLPLLQQARLLAQRYDEAYGLQDELSPEVPDDQITLYRPNREEDIKRLLS